MVPGKLRHMITSNQSSTPAFYTGACEAPRLASGAPTGVTARLAYPSSSLGRLKEAESPGHGSSQNERDASLIPLRFGGQQRREYTHPKGAYRYVCSCGRPGPAPIDAHHSVTGKTMDQVWPSDGFLERRDLLCPAECRAVSAGGATTRRRH